MEKIEFLVAQEQQVTSQESVSVGNQLWELSSLQLALVGGGSGDVTLV